MDERFEIFDIKRRDILDLTRLAQDYFAELKACDEGLKMAPNWEKDYFDLMELGLRANHFFMRGVSIDREMAAFIMFSYRVESMWLLASRGYISDIYVVPAHRNQGIGRKLVSEAMHHLQQAGVQSVEMEVYIANDPGQKFWEKMGFAPFKTRNRIMLRD